MFKLQRSSPLPSSKRGFKSPPRKEVRGELIPTGWKYQFFIFGIIFILVLGVVSVSTAQQTDTTQTIKELEQEQSFPQPYHSERSTDSFLMSSTGTYNVPEPTEYYTPPFKGQEYLDHAVEAYRKKLENSLANTKLFQILGKIAPFIMNQFEFGVYQIYDLPIVERDHPLLNPQVGEDEQE